MPDLKSQGDEYIPIFKALFLDVEALTGLNMDRDFQELENRVSHEGLPFLTKTLPSLYKHILRCIEAGHFSPVAGFRTQRKGPLPIFLRGLVEGLFEKKDGTLKIVRQSPWLGYIGQICTFLYKCEFPYTELQMAERLRKFMEVEKSLPEHLGCFPDAFETTLRNAIEFGRLIHKGFSHEGMLPRHGPGAVADRSKRHEKYVFSFSERIDSVFPFEDWFAPMGVEGVIPPVHAEEAYKPYLWVHPVLGDPLFFEDELPPARGLFVNKDTRGPRYISAEPKELMWLQQGLGRALVRHYEHNPLTSGHVNFTDQSVNGRLALLESKNRHFATLDMEDASDRVSLALVRHVLPSHIVRLLEACRSESALLPQTLANNEFPELAGRPACGRELPLQWKYRNVLTLKKFAPMGSACCFPIESIVFFILATACISTNTGWSLRRASRCVYVYGDDLIVPAEFSESIIQFFEAVGLRFNRAKCFLNGPFRESCGVDAIDGYIVTPIKLRKPLPKTEDDISGYISWVDTCNQFYYAGLWRTAQAVQDLIDPHHRLPIVPYQSGCIGLTAPLSDWGVEHRHWSVQKVRWNKRLQILEVRVRRIRKIQRLLHEDESNFALPKSATLHTLVNNRSERLGIELSCRSVGVSSTLTDLDGALTARSAWKDLS